MLRRLRPKEEIAVRSSGSLMLLICTSPLPKTT